MKNFTVKQNKLLEKDVQGFYNTEYVGYQQEGNPDFINHLKNMTKQLKIVCKLYWNQVRKVLYYM